MSANFLYSNRRRESFLNLNILLNIQVVIHDMMQYH
jgi:hypothetical protein